jgi:hypothetical protein
LFGAGASRISGAPDRVAENYVPRDCDDDALSGRWRLAVVVPAAIVLAAGGLAASRLVDRDSGVGPLAWHSKFPPPLLDSPSFERSVVSVIFRRGRIGQPQPLLGWSKTASRIDDIWR